MGSGARKALGGAAALAGAVVLAAAAPGPEAAPAGGTESPVAVRAPGGPGLIPAWTGRRAELVETVPIARERRARPRVVLSLPLPRVKPGDVIRHSAEVTATTTCVEPLPRCIGRPYAFDPHIGARTVIAERPRAGAPSQPVSDRETVTCEQTRPNRNHHCPLVLRDELRVGSAAALPCDPRECRLNVLLDAHHRRREGGEVIVVGADRPDGTVEGGKARLSAAVERGSADVRRRVRRTSRRRSRTLPPYGSPRVVLSQRLADPREGDVLLVRARQRTRIRELPYFVAAKVVIAPRAGASNPGRLGRRVASRAGTATETNGFNCTVGPSAFRTPCLTEKAGLAAIKRTPQRPVYVNVVMRSFPKRAQARGGYPPARVVRGGELRVTRLRPRD